MTVPPLSPAELVARSDMVVEGRVVDAQTRWVGRRIITFYVVEHRDGATTTTTLVAIPGGAVGRFAQKVPGAPVLDVGARYRLHLGRADGPRLAAGGPSSRGVVGFFRGAAQIVDVAGGPPVLVPFNDDGVAAGGAP